MIRFIFSAIATIIVIAVFAFLWLTNPLYAFVGAVVFLVFMLVGFASWLNSSQGNISPEEKKTLDPRRTGEYRRPERVAKPESEWSDNSVSGARAIEPEDPQMMQPQSKSSMFPGSGSSASAPPKPSAPPASVKTEPEPAPPPESVMPPTPEPKPVIVQEQEKSEDGSAPDFNSMSPEEMMRWMESLAKRQDTSEGLTTEADIDVPEIEEDDERLRGMGEYKPYGMSDENWQAMQERDSTEKSRRARSEVPVIDGLENTDVLNISDGDIADIEDEIEESEPDFEVIVEDMKSKIDSGTSGDSPEEVEEFFKTAFEQAETFTDVPDMIDFADSEYDFDDEFADTEFADWIHNLPEGGTEEIHGWLNTDSDATEKGQKTARFITSEDEAGHNQDSDTLIDYSVFDEEPGEIPDWLMVLEEEKDLLEEEIAEASAGEDSPVRTDSGEFDLMGMIGSLEPDKQQEFYALLTEVPIGEQTETQLMRMYEKLRSNDADSKADSGKKISEAQFTAYYPRQVSAKTEYGFYVYAHEPDALLESDIQQFQQELGGRVPKPKIADEKATIEEGATLAVMIHCDALEFNQVGAMQQWKAPFVRFDFKFTADDSLVDEIVEGRIAILMGMIEIASIDFQLAITPANRLAMVTAIPHNPLTAPNFEPGATVGLYQKIFISYSRKDTVIAEQYRKVQMMAGNMIFMDTHSIRAGEDWEVALKRFINEADVFQLFWSQHSASSDHVRFEWEYALTQRCPDTRCVQFIRPAYWQKPLPDIPPELNHLHFAFVEMED